MRFLHTSDWQMGMRRHFLDQHNQAVFSQSRFDVIRQIMRVAKEADCEFIVVAGDVFESNQVDPVTVSRTMDALNECTLPVFLLPANHDPLDAASVYRSAQFKASKPAHVTVLAPGEVYRIGDNVEVIGATWTSKRMARNPLADLLETLQPTDEASYRIVVAHGAADSLSPMSDLTAVPIDLSAQAMAEERMHYLALGDRHSTTMLHDRIWFSGSPEPTDYDEDAPGNVLLVELSPGKCSVEHNLVSTWKFVRLNLELPLESPADVLRSALENIPDKSRTIVRCILRGTISLQDAVEIDTIISQQRERFGAIERPTHHDELSILPKATDFSELQVTGFVKNVLEQLVAEVRSGGEQATTAKGSLALLYRLTDGGRV